MRQGIFNTRNSCSVPKPSSTNGSKGGRARRQELVSSPIAETFFEDPRWQSYAQSLRKAVDSAWDDTSGKYTISDLRPLETVLKNLKSLMLEMCQRLGKSKKDQTQVIKQNLAKQFEGLESHLISAFGLINLRLKSQSEAYKFQTLDTGDEAVSYADIKDGIKALNGNILSIFESVYAILDPRVTNRLKQYFKIQVETENPICDYKNACLNNPAAKAHKKNLHSPMSISVADSSRQKKLTDQEVILGELQEILTSALKQAVPVRGLIRKVRQCYSDKARPYLGSTLKDSYYSALVKFAFKYVLKVLTQGRDKVIGDIELAYQAKNGSVTKVDPDSIKRNGLFAPLKKIIQRVVRHYKLPLAA